MEILSQTKKAVASRPVLQEMLTVRQREEEDVGQKRGSVKGGSGLAAERVHCDSAGGGLKSLLRTMNDVT